MPVVIRYPKDAAETDEKINQSCDVPFEKSKSVDIINNNSDIVLVCFGSVIKQALQASLELKKDGINTDIINARFAKPIDDRIVELTKLGKTIITIEDGSLAGGFGSAVLEQAAKHNCQNKIINLAAPDEFIQMASRSKQFQMMQIDAEAIVKAVKQI
jgi:1-deoxy-D-xylulose-5-phosphate synthase